MSDKLTLISHKLCPYVQRVAIVLKEKHVPYVRHEIDLRNKPRWFLEVSPLGKTPALVVDGTTLFESTVICEYLEEVYPHPLHPEHPLERARHRSWMEYGSSILNNIAGFYSAPDEQALREKAELMARQFYRLEGELSRGPYFSGVNFSMVDAFFGPIFRYFDVFEEILKFDFFERCPGVRDWRGQLAVRDSVQSAATRHYSKLLYDFLRNRASMLSSYMTNRPTRESESAGLAPASSAGCREDST